MKLPVSWLSDYIDIADLSVQELAERITFAGIEIEGIEQVGPCFDNIVAGEVRACAPHPDSDHLHVARVFDGDAETQVVCGAPNCRAGIVVPFARIGAVMADGTAIKKGKLRGVESFGMLCSGRELGLSGDHEGILEMDPATKPGTPLAEIYGEAETVFDVEITWNRPDCLSIIGIAREFAAILGRPLKMPAIDFPVSGRKAADLCSVTVHNPAQCPHYLARVLTHVERLPSPDWMRRRLELCGMRSIDVVVDVSNYVMLECGQPLHTFDYDQVADHAIHVRNATDGEKIKTLDDVERALDADTLLIADTAGPLAIAGVMGGEGSEIRPETRAVLLESASFAAPSVKRTATALGMRTESSHRFERGVDPFLTDWASRRACALLVRHANGVVAEGVVEADARPKEKTRVTLRFRRACEVIGLDIPADRQVAILASLGFALESSTDATATFAVPTCRVDVDCEADLIEEVARMSGLDALPDVLPATTIVPDADDSPARAASACRHTLVALGFSEIMNYSFTAPATLDALTPSAAGRRVVLPNPVSADNSVLRDSLVPQMVETMGGNNAHGNATAALFEMGRVFFKDAKGAIAEEDRVCVGVMGFAGRSGLDSARAVEPSESALWLKGALEALLARLHAPQMRLEPVAAEGFEPGFAARIIIAGREAGVIGLVAGALRRHWRIASPLVVAEIRRDAILGNVFKVVAARDVPAFPATTRDIALVAGDGVTHEQILKTIRKAAPPELEDVRLFDIFKGRSLGAGKTSLAYSLTYRAAGRTLTDEEANAFHNKIKDALKAALALEIREG
ncbi:MAG: phenylalanine--tRNA ligase subunit beta [Kiritimatiellia bacterium]|jgi:phenylalanyl-tRNA synthetase beta chain